MREPKLDDIPRHFLGQRLCAGQIKDERATRWAARLCSVSGKQASVANRARSRGRCPGLGDRHRDDHHRAGHHLACRHLDGHHPDGHRRAGHRRGGHHRADRGVLDHSSHCRGDLDHPSCLRDDHDLDGYGRVGLGADENAPNAVGCRS